MISLMVAGAGLGRGRLPGKRWDHGAEQSLDKNWPERNVVCSGLGGDGSCETWN